MASGYKSVVGSLWKCLEKGVTEERGMKGQTGRRIKQLQKKLFKWVVEVELSEEWAVHELACWRPCFLIYENQPKYKEQKFLSKVVFLEGCQREVFLTECLQCFGIYMVHGRPVARHELIVIWWRKACRKKNRFSHLKILCLDSTSAQSDDLEARNLEVKCSTAVSQKCW